MPFCDFRYKDMLVFNEVFHLSIWKKYILIQNNIY